MTLEYEITADDYGAFWTYHHEHRAATRRTVRWLQFLCPAMWLILEFQSVRDGQYGSLTFFALLSLVWILALPACYRWSIRRNVKRMAAEGLCRGSIGRQELMAFEDGLTVSNSFSETTTR